MLDRRQRISPGDAEAKLKVSSKFQSTVPPSSSLAAHKIGRGSACCCDDLELLKSMVILDRVFKVSSGGAIGSGTTATIATTSGTRQIVYSVTMVAATISTAKF